MPQRSYTPHALEVWFARMEGDWESAFSEAELKWGRAFYCNQEVRSTELMEESAIIHFKRGRDPFYVVVDWHPTGIQFRFSHPESTEGRGMGVAGLYEIEELIADELPAVPADKPKVVKPTEEGTERRIEPPARKPDGRGIKVRLLPLREGLRLEGGFTADDNTIDWGRFVPLKGSLRLASHEREQVIAFTAFAHRSGFRPGDREGVYQLQGAEAVERFFKHHLADWQHRFDFNMAASLRPWMQGVQRVTPVLQVHEHAEGSSFHLELRSGSRFLNPALREELMRGMNRAHFITGEGIFEFDAAAREVLAEWRAWLGTSGDGTLPRYLVFALAQEPSIQIDLSASLNDWMQQLQRAELTAAPPRLPDYLRGYQKEGVHWLMQIAHSQCHGLLADEMGLGKTLQVLTYLNAVGSLGSNLDLVVCPASVVPVWQAEIQRFFPEFAVHVIGRGQMPDPAQPALWLASYTQVRRNKSALERCPFSHVILDEAQSVKNPDAKVTQACYALNARHRIALTGTPVENRPLDLWSIFRFLMPGYLGSRRRFEDDSRNQPAFLDRIKRLIQPFILRRRKEAVAKDLPPKVEILLPCPLTDCQRRLYSAIAAAAISGFSDEFASGVIQRRMHLLSLLTRLRQASCDPALLPGSHGSWEQSGKLLQLRNQLDEAFAGNSKVVVFSQFVKFLNRARQMVEQQFPNVPQFLLTGATQNRARPVQDFSSQQGHAVFFVSLKAGGTGLNLQAADYVFLLDPWWNPAVEAQAIDRVHRIGQTQHVFVYRLIAVGSIEDRIQALKLQKSQLFFDLLPDSAPPQSLLQQFHSLRDLVALQDSSAFSS